MIISASVDYFNALAIERFRGTQWAKLGLISSVVINLGLLFLFKYSGFLYENINLVFGLNLEIPSFTLPIGISFYTFQTISYVIDVYRGEVKAQQSYMKFTMFVSLYHQLVAGPIVRYSHIAHEIDNRVFDIKDISEGVTRFCFGLFKKVFFANVAGQLATQYLNSDLEILSVSAGWFGMLMFSLQIYFDFSGYSDMAIGLGKMYGFHYHENFNYPYIARSATDFWRRWHISLGSFLRDYVYIPLGGNKKHQLLNILLVWFLTGFWHGANWNFILWGMYFGVLVGIEKIFLYKLLEKLPKIVGHLYLLIAAFFGWILFYFTDLKRLGNFVQLLFGKTKNAVGDFELELVIKNHIFWLLFALICCMPVYQYVTTLLKKYTKDDVKVQWFFIVLSFLALSVSTALLVGKSYNPFLYFRF